MRLPAQLQGQLEFSRETQRTQRDSNAELFVLPASSWRAFRPLLGQAEPHRDASSLIHRQHFHEGQCDNQGHEQQRHSKVFQASGPVYLDDQINAERAREDPIGPQERDGSTVEPWRRVAPDAGAQAEIEIGRKRG